MEKTKKRTKNKKKTRSVIKKIILICFILALALCLFVGVANAVNILPEKKFIISRQEAAAMDADCVMVLGCGLLDAQTPSWLLQNRLDRGIEVFTLGAGKKLLMSGDHGRKGYDEVNVMKRYAVERGISGDDVFMDHAGFTTYESMYRARDVFGVKKMIVVTQRYHLYRALYLAHNLGIEAYGVAAEDVAPDQRIRDVREVGARCKAFIWSIVKPKPTYLGDPISLEGSGSVTDDEYTPLFAEG